MNIDEIEKDIIKQLKKIYHISSNGYVVKSGTTALLECLLAIGVDKGDEIILPVSICDSVVKAVKNLSLIPILVDVDRHMGIERSAVERAITKRTRAVLVWHAYGRVTDIRWIKELKQKYGEMLCFIEDCAQVLGAESKDIAIGTECDFSIFSFGSSKPVPAKGGGVFFINNMLCETVNNSFTDKNKCDFLHQRDMPSLEQLLYDDRLLVKPTKSAISYMPTVTYEIPYENAKEMLLVEEIDNKDFLTGLFNVMYDELPTPKPKKKK